MMCAVAETKPNNDSQRDGGVLANLPRTRPQRASARRTAARGGAPAQARPRKPARAERSPAKSRGALATPAQAPASGASAAAATPPAKANSRVRATRPAAATARSGSRRRAPARNGRARPAGDAAPRQGFESDSEASGGSVQPPGGVEFVATAAEIVGELAKAGLSTGERLVRDVLSRLPLS
jgi:hypothetical protein